MVWNMLVVQCKAVEDQAAIKETVESLSRLGYPELIVRSDTEPAMLAFRDAVIRELKEHFGVRAIAQTPPKYDFCVSWRGGERHQTGEEEGANIGDCNSRIARCCHGPWTCGAGMVCTVRWSDDFPYREMRRWAHCVPACVRLRRI